MDNAGTVEIYLVKNAGEETTWAREVVLITGRNL